MVDLHRGVQSYLISKSSLEQDGYERAPDTVRRPSQLRDPEGVPIATVATPNKFRTPEKVSRGERNFFARGDAMVNPSLNRSQPTQPRARRSTAGAPLF